MAGAPAQGKQLVHGLPDLDFGQAASDRVFHARRAPANHREAVTPRRAFELVGQAAHPVPIACLRRTAEARHSLRHLLDEHRDNPRQIGVARQL
jgi:hypothetical protein